MGLCGTIRCGTWDSKKEEERNIIGVKAENGKRKTKKDEEGSGAQRRKTGTRGDKI